MSLSNAERQKRFLQKLKDRAAAADLADAMMQRFRQGALAALAEWSSDKPGDPAKAIAAEIDGRLQDDAAMLQAAALAGASWARQEFVGRQNAKGRRRP